MSSIEKQIVQDTEIPQSHQSEQVKTLWMLACRTKEGHMHQLVPFYALSTEDAEQQIQQWLSEQPCSIVRISLRLFPNGFVICRQRLRGTMA
ncbi:MAG TPA: hypothetical protein VKU38_22895 [Ktedonobacteraceae bacterium]|nr:hypothetical protein [Ktedonobacteraceae bacterium]